MGFNHPLDSHLPVSGTIKQGPKKYSSHSKIRDFWHVQKIVQYDLVQPTTQFLLANFANWFYLPVGRQQFGAMVVSSNGHISQAARVNPTSILTIVINMIMLIMIVIMCIYHYHDYDIVKQNIYDNMIIWYIYMIIWYMYIYWYMIYDNDNQYNISIFPVKWRVKDQRSGSQELRSNIARLQGQAKPVGFEHPGRHLASPKCLRFQWFKTALIHSFSLEKWSSWDNQSQK